MKPMSKGDLLRYVMEEAVRVLIGPRGVILDHVSYAAARNISSILQAESGLEPVVDHQEVDPDKALAALLVGLGMWYAGGSMQDAVTAAATLVNAMGKVTA
jgi:hypothetical protein